MIGFCAQSNNLKKRNQQQAMPDKYARWLLPDSVTCQTGRNGDRVRVGDGGMVKAMTACLQMGWRVYKRLFVKRDMSNR